MPQDTSSGSILPFFGADLDLTTCEALAVQHIPAKLMQTEAALMQSKWFDYRFWHPVIATYAFAQAYDAAYKAITQYARDVERGAYIKGFKGEDIFTGKEITGFWKARQAADAIGCPYPFFCRTVMRWAEERCWTRFPRPTQLYSEEALAAVIDAWENETQARLMTAEHAALTAAAYQGSPEQAAYQAWLIRQVSLRQHKQFGLHYLIKVKGHLVDALARRAFGRSLVERALAIELE